MLLDVEDVAAGHETKMRWNERGDWVWASEPTHEAIINPETFTAVQSTMAASAHRPTPQKRNTTTRVYPLSGLVRCAVCGRRMQGSFNHDANHYRCRYPSEYARVKELDHPKAVYVREAAITERLDGWLGQLFAPANLDATCEALAMAGGADDSAAARIDAAERQIADCYQRLAKYRAALDAGADPTVVAGWMAEVQGERLRAEQELSRARPGEPMSKAQIRKLIKSLRDITAVLAEADPKLKAEVYAELGVSVEYDPALHLVTATASPDGACTTDRVGGGT